MTNQQPSRFILGLHALFPTPIANTIEELNQATEIREGGVKMNNRLQIALNPMLGYETQKRFLSAFLDDPTITPEEKRIAQDAYAAILDKLADPVLRAASKEEDRLAKEHASNRRKLINNEKD